MSDEPLVEAGLVISAKGALITLVNWSENSNYTRNPPLLVIAWVFCMGDCL